MQCRQRMNEERCRQLWLLLLVPWLWLSGFSEAMHHHSFDTGAPASVVAASPSTASHSTIADSQQHKASSSSALCAICQWQHSNQTHVFVASPLSPVLDAIVVHPSYSLALLSRDGAISRSRGPPSC